MATRAYRIWCNMSFPEGATQLLREGTAGHELLLSKSMTASNLAAAGEDPAMMEADVIFGQPDPGALGKAGKLKWVHLTSAGYERYDKPEVRMALAARGVALTTSSGVYADPCAEHALAMMLGVARQLPRAWEEQAGGHGWPAAEIRANSRLLLGQTVLMLGYGSIGRRLAELLAPFKVNLFAIRRSPKGETSVATYPESYLDRLLPAADHVVNILPGGEGTKGFMTGERLGKMKPGAVYYSIGRGTTTDQEGLVEALRSKRIGGAYLDVTDPEPLPGGHALWTTPGCYITPHTAGGHQDEFQRLVRHFLENLALFGEGKELRDRVV